jgi:CheY-like chemotaxis protein
MAGPLTGTAVLVVEDDTDSAEVLSLYLASTGATVRVAGCGKDALELAKGWKPDVMLLDISLPEMNGYDLLKALRLDPALRGRPAIAVTAHAFERDRQRAAEAGFSVHVAKPFDAEALLHLIVRLTTDSPAATDPPIVRDFHTVLDLQGLHEALGFLNRRTGHRFTAVRRFDRDVVRGVHLFDRTDPKKQRGKDTPLDESLDAVVKAERRPLVVADTRAEPRLADHTIAGGVRSYCGVLLRNLDGTPYGTVCHFDLVPVPVTSESLNFLLLAAPLLAAHVAPPETPLGKAPVEG